MIPRGVMRGPRPPASSNFVNSNLPEESEQPRQLGHHVVNTSKSTLEGQGNANINAV